MQRTQLNTVAAGCMKLLNLLHEIPNLTPESGDNNENFYFVNRRLMYRGLSILLRSLTPIAPHITHYLWRHLNFGRAILKASWPKVANKALKCDYITMVVQINGKLRSRISVLTDANHEDIEKAALSDEKVQPYTENKQIKKIIVVPNKLVNIVVGG